MMIGQFMSEKIELLGTVLLGEYRDIVCELTKMQHSLALSSGWHYLLDWAWVISNLGDVTGKTILDAGAGIGLLQWYLAKQGANIISVDRLKRNCIPFHLIKRFNISGYTPQDEPLSMLDMLNLTNRKASFPVRMKSLVRGLVGESRLSRLPYQKTQGSVSIYNHDLRFMDDIPNESVDIIVSISALEHNITIGDVRTIIMELMRIIKPGGIMLITLPASNNGDWFFNPAFSWCFCEDTLRNLFGFSEDIPSNFNEYESLINGLKQSDELKKNLAWDYYLRPNTGMPWGIWKPQYMPVGVLKIKI